MHDPIDVRIETRAENATRITDRYNLIAKKDGLEPIVKPRRIPPKQRKSS